MSTTQPKFDDASMQWIPPALLVDAVVDGQARQLSVGGLECVVGGHENDDEWVSWIEYRQGESVVHRSVRMHLKKGLLAEGAAASFA
jgi:hypothetical protein